MTDPSQNPIREIAEFLTKDFQISPQDGFSDEEKLAQVLSLQIRKMLDMDFGRFLQICYRVDLGEHKLKAILSESPPDQVSINLARELIARQQQKILTRRKYSG